MDYLINFERNVDLKNIHISLNEKSDVQTYTCKNMSEYSFVCKNIIDDCPISDNSINITLPVFYETFIGIVNTENMLDVSLLLKNNNSEFNLKLQNVNGIWKISKLPLPLYYNTTNLNCNLTIVYNKTNKKVTDIININITAIYGVFSTEIKNLISNTPVYKIPLLDNVYISKTNRIEKTNYLNKQENNHINLICGYVNII